MTHVPPPFDPELAGALELIKDMISPGLTLDQIAEVRQGPGIELLAELDLTMGGTFEVEDRQVPGPEGEPDISLLICRPAAPAAAGARPVIYHVHGGGMIIGEQPGRGRCPAGVGAGTGRGGGVRGVPAGAGAPAPRAGRGRVRRAAVDGRRTPPSSAATPSGSSSRVRARAAGCARPWPC